MFVSDLSHFMETAKMARQRMQKRTRKSPTAQIRDLKMQVSALKIQLDNLIVQLEEQQKCYENALFNKEGEKKRILSQLIDLEREYVALRAHTSKLVMKNIRMKGQIKGTERAVNSLIGALNRKINLVPVSVSE